MFDLMKYTKTEQEKILKSMVILVDTREHDGKNDHILSYFNKAGIAWKKQKLDHGDYSVAIPANEELDIPRDLDFSNKICVERKRDIDEWLSNLQKDREAVKKKFALMPEHKILLIENNSYADVINGKYMSKYEPKSFWGTLHQMWADYNIPVIFMPEPKYTGFFIRGYLQYYIRGLIK